MFCEELKSMEYYDVDGFRFFNKDEYNAALKDKETIDYINKRFDFSNTKSVLNLYYKMVSDNTFKTVVGQAYLKKIYDALVKIPSTNKESLPMIVISDEIKDTRMDKGINKSYDKKIEMLSSQLSTCKIVIFFMVMVILAMFVITLDNDSLNYNNAYNAVVDEYEGWEKELELREKELDEREKMLEEKEKILDEDENNKK